VVRRPEGQAVSATLAAPDAAGRLEAVTRLLLVVLQRDMASRDVAVTQVCVRVRACVSHHQPFTLPHRCAHYKLLFTTPSSLRELASVARMPP
jgi:hypothetical protein